jgi:carbamoyl-phosphate synthase large subunit
MIPQTIKVLVPLDGHITRYSGAGIIKSLALSDIELRVYCIAPTPDIGALYLANHYELCPQLKDSGYMDWVVAFCRLHQIDVILPDAADFNHFATQKDFIRQACGSVVLAQPVPVIAMTENKLSTAVWLQQQGLPHPRFASASDVKAVRTLVATVGFPLIAKPYVGEGSKGVLLVRDEAELLQAMQRPDTLLQQYVGTDEAEYTVCCCIDNAGTLQGSFVFRRKLWNGISVHCEVDRNSAVLSASEQIASRLGGRGSMNIQLRFDEGRPLCLEVNARFSGTVGMRAQLGFNDVAFCLRHYLFKEPAVPLPVITRGIAIRTFTEVYPPELAGRSIELARLPGSR